MKFFRFLCSEKYVRYERPPFTVCGNCKSVYRVRINSISNEDTIPAKNIGLILMILKSVILLQDHDYCYYNISKRDTTCRYNNIQIVHYVFNETMKTYEKYININVETERVIILIKRI